MTRVAFLFAILAACALPASSQPGAYNQPYRPQVHFSPRQHWTNDPNGLVYYRGEYHLFFQYNPFGDEWGHMSWGHAVSTDLLHWHELPVAIPEHDGMMIFTGSVVVDRENTSGFCAPKSDCLVAIYTGYSHAGGGERQAQYIAHSRDRGRSWIDYPGNPVIDLHLTDFRDPSVFWHDAARHWVMAVSLPLEHKIRFYSSPDLKTWHALSDFGPAGDIDGAWECPDLLRIPASDGKASIWALKVGLNPGAPQGGSGEQYFLGNFDGKDFTASKDPGSHGWTNYGKDDYCAISFNGIPKDEKPVLLGWMSNWQYAAKLPTSPWRGQMSLPRQLSFIQDKAGLALRQEPVISPLRFPGPPVAAVSPGNFHGAKLAKVEAPYEIQLNFSGTSHGTFGIRIYSDTKHWTEIAFDPQKAQLYMDRTQSSVVAIPDFALKTTAPVVPDRGYDLKLIVDRSSIEASAQNGTIAMTNLIYPATTANRMDDIEVFSSEGKPSVVRAEVWKLRSSWK
ncbi:MAG TPA: glycoside hydrolase family 32 protein [Terriglobales bacterium]|nr:glycoside hydrolase family 32 protein [Terriglobales bacterium]